MVDETEYQSVYDAINDIFCPYEKALLHQHCQCEMGDHFCLADRLGVGCKSKSAQQKCLHYLSLVQENARFVLQSTKRAGQLPHNKSIRIQVGGLTGLNAVLQPASEEINVYALLQLAESQYVRIEDLPFDEIIKHVAQFSGRERKRRSRLK